MHKNLMKFCRYWSLIGSIGTIYTALIILAQLEINEEYLIQQEVYLKEMVLNLKHQGSLKCY